MKLLRKLKKARILLKLKVCFVSLLIACPSIPSIHWKAKIWAGDSSRVSIRRAQDSEEIYCNDPAFDSYVCITYEDLEELYEILLNCKSMSSTAIEAKAAFIYCGLDTNKNISLVKNCIKEYRKNGDTKK